MNPTERFYKIELLIRNRGVVSFADLLSELEVSRATLTRDLQYLRDRMNAPIVFDRDGGGYRFDKTSKSLPHYGKTQGVCNGITLHKTRARWSMGRSMHPRRHIASWLSRDST